MKATSVAGKVLHIKLKKNVLLKIVLNLSRFLMTLSNPEGLKGIKKTVYKLYSRKKRLPLNLNCKLLHPCLLLKVVCHYKIRNIS